MIPFLDLKAPYLELKHAIDEAIGRVVSSGWFIGGSEVEEFEAEYANGAYDHLLPKKYQAGKGQPDQEKRLATMDFYVGQRVSMHPATDAFMMGDRYGEVVKVGKSKIHVKMDRSGKTRLVSPGNLEHIS